MKFTDIFIRRPVLATVVSLLILVLGLRSVSLLPVLQYPRTENAVVTVSTTYFGASADVVSGFITTPLENSIAQANGIDYMNSISQQGISTIQIQIRLNYDSAKALTEINTRVNAVRNQLPAEAQQPPATFWPTTRSATICCASSHRSCKPSKAFSRPNFSAKSGLRCAYGWIPTSSPPMD
jgi:multidrug efflux pump